MLALRKKVKPLKGPWRVRVLLYSDGRINIECARLTEIRQPYLLQLASAAIDKRNLFLYHKTTNRSIYENMLKGIKGAKDILFYNSDEEVTETSIGNVVIKINNELVTPPVSCGLLPGVMREHLLRKGIIREKVVKINNLWNAKEIWVINSVRGWIKAQLIYDNKHNKFSKISLEQTGTARHSCAS